MTRYFQGLRVGRELLRRGMLDDIRQDIRAVSGIEAIIEAPEQRVLSDHTFWAVTKDLPPFEAGKVIEILLRIGSVSPLLVESVSFLPTITASGFWGLTDL